MVWVYYVIDRNNFHCRQEIEFEQYFLRFAKIYYGLTYIQTQKLHYDYRFTPRFESACQLGMQQNGRKRLDIFGILFINEDSWKNYFGQGYCFKPNKR